MGERYTLRIANLNKTLLMVLLTVFSAPLLFLISHSTENAFLNHYRLIFFFLHISTVAMFIVWILRKSKNDTFQITSLGIESGKNGIIEWQEIENCSLETISHGTFVFIKKKNKIRYSIAASFTRNKSIEENDIWNFFDEIKSKREELPEINQFKISVNRLSNNYMLTGIILLVGTFIALITYNVFLR